MRISITRNQTETPGVVTKNQNFFSPKFNFEGKLNGVRPYISLPVVRMFSVGETTSYAQSPPLQRTIGNDLSHTKQKLHHNLGDMT